MSCDPWRWRLHVPRLEVEHLAPTQIPIETDSHHQLHLHQPALAHIQYHSNPCALRVRLLRFSRSCFSKTLQASQSPKDATRNVRENSGSRNINPAIKRSANQLIFPFSTKMVIKEHNVRSMSSSSTSAILIVGTADGRLHGRAESLQSGPARRAVPARASAFSSRRTVSRADLVDARRAWSVRRV